jgi:hypothetical protein
VRVALAQGVAFGGSGVLFDDGGGDVFHAASGTRAAGRIEDYGGLLPISWTLAQGAVNALGTGLLIEGKGDTRYDLEVRGDGVGYWFASIGQGGSYLAFGPTASATLVDQGGDDTYALTNALTYAIDASIDDTTCPAHLSGCADVEVVGGPIAQILIGQGGSSFLGAGTLIDQSGDDRYRSSARNEVSASLSDRRTASGAAASLHAASFWAPRSTTQGAAELEAFGALLDGGRGADSYVIEDAAVVIGRASRDQGTAPVVTAYADPGIAPVEGQGAGRDSAIGALIDDGASGPGQRLEATSRDVAVAEPDGHGAFVGSRGDFVPMFQGAHYSEGAGYLIAPQSESILSTPNQPVCAPSKPGYRGWGVWYDCGSSLGPQPSAQPIANPGAPLGGFGLTSRTAGAEPILAFSDDTSASAPIDRSPRPDPAGPRLTAVARLLDPYTGAPLEHANVRFTLEVGCTWPGCSVLGDPPQPIDGIGATWHPLWVVDAVTGADGVARADVPAVQTGPWADSAPYDQWRIRASYDGGVSPEGGDIFPAQSAYPVVLTQ